MMLGKKSSNSTQSHCTKTVSKYRTTLTILLINVLQEAFGSQLSSPMRTTMRCKNEKFLRGFWRRKSAQPYLGKHDRDDTRN